MQQISKSKDKLYTSVYVFKIKIVKSSLWSLEPRVIKLDKKSIFFPHSNEAFLLE